MKYVFIWAVLVFSIVGDANAADPGPKNGFRDMRWGDKPDRQMLNLNTKEGNMDIYTKTNDSKSVAGADEWFISYAYYYDRLCGVKMMEFLDDITKMESVKKSIDLEWGKPDEHFISADMQNFSWLSKDTKTKARFYAIRDIIGKTDRRIVTFFIEDTACAEEAIRNPGL